MKASQTNLLRHLVTPEASIGLFGKTPQSPLVFFLLHFTCPTPTNLFSLLSCLDLIELKSPVESWREKKISRYGPCAPPDLQPVSRRPLNSLGSEAERRLVCQAPFSPLFSATHKFVYLASVFTFST